MTGRRSPVLLIGGSQIVWCAWGKYRSATTFLSLIGASFANDVIYSPGKKSISIGRVAMVIDSADVLVLLVESAFNLLDYVPWRSAGEFMDDSYSCEFVLKAADKD